MTLLQKNLVPKYKILNTLLGAFITPFQNIPFTIPSILSWNMKSQ
jgi:hypothetical protein